MYTPNPIKTDDIILDDSLLALCEEIAKNTHEVWAAGRIADGWTYGPVRDDAAKKHPCLIPYEELPEEEKAYDRATSLQTLKLVAKLGYTIARGDKE
jgi:ryanodine receptor 2